MSWQSGQSKENIQLYTSIEDTSEVSYSKINEFSLDRYRSDPAYTYDSKIVSVNYWQKFINWLMRKMNMDPGSVVGAFFNRTFWFVIFFGLIIFLIIKLFGSEIRAFFYRDRAVPLAMQTLEENINEIKFEDRISEAVKQGNYRYAVRLHYLQSLKDLNDRELIQWEKDKTNRDYYYELSGKQIQGPFAGITTLFNWIWYGDKPVDQLSFQSVAEQFKKFNLSLRSA
jgi:hypothetical protein